MLGDVAHRVTAVQPTDADVGVPRDGMVIADASGNLWLRSAGVWLCVGQPISSGSTVPTVNNGGTATFSGVACLWWQIGKVVTFVIVFGVTAAGSGAVAVTVTGTGLPQPVTNARIAGDRGGVGVGPIFGRLQASGGEGQITAITTYLAMGTALTGADLATGAAYTIVGSYIAA